MNPVFAWEVCFGLCVNVGGQGAESSVYGVGVKCSVSVDGVYMCAE